MGVQGAGDIILYDTLENQYLSTSYSIYDLSQQYYFQITADEDGKISLADAAYVLTVYAKQSAGLDT
ncbi:MAG: hypothetical protein ACI4JD_00825 [Ruminococcus sp.]